jgi:hypothetical protein
VGVSSVQLFQLFQVSLNPFLPGPVCLRWLRSRWPCGWLQAGNLLAALHWLRVVWTAAKPEDLHVRLGFHSLP